MEDKPWQKRGGGAGRRGEHQSSGYIMPDKDANKDKDKDEDKE